METQINWFISGMSVKPHEGSYDNVVVSAQWNCVGKYNVDPKTDMPQYSGSVNGVSNFSAPKGSFTPYAELTQDQVLSWCWGNGVDKAQIEASVAKQIEVQIHPPVVSLPLPWK